MSAILQISDLSAGYGPLRVLHEINFTVERGERLERPALSGEKVVDAMQHQRTAQLPGRGDQFGARQATLRQQHHIGDGR